MSGSFRCSAFQRIISQMRVQVTEEMVSRHIPERAYAEQWDAAGLEGEVRDVFGIELPVVDWSKEEGIAEEEMRERINEAVNRRAAERAANFGPEIMRYIEKTILLQTLDHDWREHIVQLEHLRQYVGLRGYGQRDPLNEYKAEAFNLFETMSQGLREGVTAQLMRVEIVQQQPDNSVPSNRDPLDELDRVEEGQADDRQGHDGGKHQRCFPDGWQLLGLERQHRECSASHGR